MTIVNTLIQDLNDSYSRLTLRLSHVTAYTTAGELRPELEDLENRLGELRRQLAIFPEEVLDVDYVETSSSELDALIAMTIPAEPIPVILDVNLHPYELDSANDFLGRLNGARTTFVWNPASGAGTVDITNPIRDAMN